MEYAHIKDNNSGEITMVVGAVRKTLEDNEEIVRQRSMVILKDGQYCVVLNPFDKDADQIKYGDIEVRVGPDRFPLHPDEELDKTPQVGTQTFRGYKIKGRRHTERGDIDEDDGESDMRQHPTGIFDQYVLKPTKGLLVEAIKDFDDNGTARSAGEQWIIKGPCNYIPHKYARVIRKVKSISLGQFEGIYIKNVKTGEIRMEEGEKNVMLKPEEELWEKKWTRTELDALRFRDLDIAEEDIRSQTVSQSELDRIRIRRSEVRPLFVLDNEVCLIMTEDDQRIVVGAAPVMLQPFERPHIMKISGGTPKSSDRPIKIWKIRLGPTLSSDIIEIRTKDNAVLRMRLRYNWRFNFDEANPKKIFTIPDFIALITETLGSLIREAVAKVTFEELHKDAAEIVKKAVFGDQSSYVFEENELEVLGIDVKSITPEDAEIAKQLNDSIKTNMNIYIEKVQQEAELEAQKQKIVGQIAVEDERKNLIEKKAENTRLEKIGLANIEAEALKIEAEGEAEKIKIESEARIQSVTDEIQKEITALSTTGGDLYLKLQQIRSIASVSKIAIVPTDSKIILPTGDILDSLK
jgi:major vault protein